MSKLLSQPVKDWEFSVVVSSILTALSYLNYIMAFLVPGWNAALLSGLLLLLHFFLIELNQRLSAWSVIPS